MTAYLDGYSGYSGVPEDAAAEILEKLMTHQQISSDEVARILKRYGVCGEPEALQIAYRKKVGQRLIASLRDPYGRREVFSTGSTYVLVDCCNDRDALEHIHKKLDKDMEANATNSMKLREIMEEKENTQQKLDEKMDRWVYLNDLAERIQAQKV
mgnify:CR=1 FL=1